MLTKPEERAKCAKEQCTGFHGETAIAQEIRAALKELVEVYRHYLGPKSIGLDVLTGIVNEVLPEEEKIR